LSSLHLSRNFSMVNAFPLRLGSVDHAKTHQK